jgi:tetratricopeptide (TPR) repeat protein
MAIDAYAPCPCGSGKKFKWCCQPIQVHIDRALRQEADGQHDAALRTLDEVIAANPANPEPLGRKAQLLYDHERVDEAESTLQKALDINPSYPFGHLLRGLFRRHEGEIAGALLLFRKAAELYDPEAGSVLARVYDLIADCELRMNRPVAARAAVDIAMRLHPPDEEQRRSLETLFGEESRLPLSARREYRFLSPRADTAPARRTAWDQALAAVASPRLGHVARAFEQLTVADGEDAAAWNNLGLVRAWLGDNRAALEALDAYVARETDDERAAGAWALSEVLRCGQGMEDEADYLEYSYTFQIRQPQQLVGFLGTWEQEQRLIGVQVREEEGMLSALVLDKVTGLTPELTAAQLPRLGAQFLIFGDRLRLSNPVREALDRVRSELQQRLGAALSEARAGRDAPPFHQILGEAMVIPVGITDQDEASRRVGEHIARFFEETWIHRPLHSLQNVPPLDAAGHGTLRRKLLGVIQFLQECGAANDYPYDFDRLRRKLGLSGTVSTPAAGAAQGPALDIPGMNVAELAALAPDSLTDEQAEQGYQTALHLDARDLAGVFARSLVSRPPNPQRTDRYPWFGHLVQLALAENDTDKALDYLNEGEKADREQNEGRRRNDYELRRAQVHAKRGEADLAQDVFERLIARVPSEMKYRSSAAEAMLSARQGPRALAFAEQGLAKAREHNDRDSENHFKELVAAAKKLAG